MYFECTVSAACCTGVIEYLETGSGSPASLPGLETETCPEEDVRTVFAGVHCALSAALRTPKLKSAVSQVSFPDPNFWRGMDYELK